MSKKNKNPKPGSQPRNRQFLAAMVNARAPQVHRKDISDWQAAKQAALRPDAPRMARLQELYSHILDDAHLSAQLSLRKSKTLGSEYVLVRPGGEIDEAASEAFVRLPATRKLIEGILDAQFFGYSLLELDPHFVQPDPLGVALIDRRHIDPLNGILLLDTSDSDGIAYRDLSEFGTFILEFRSDGLGLLDKAVPHVLFKRFAQSCWSEFCEVCGMPPRIIKTNTQDPALRNQYLNMLADYGSGANGVIDIDDEMLFVETNASNGEAYDNLIRLCSNELSLLINGAVLGQDTRYGSNSKEETSADLNDEIIEADINAVEVGMNTIVLPALQRLGILPSGLLFRFSQQEDSAQLFSQTIQAAQYFDIDPDWFRDKFGIEVLGPRNSSPIGEPPQPKQKNSDNNDPDKNKRQEEHSFSPFF